MEALLSYWVASTPPSLTFGLGSEASPTHTAKATRNGDLVTVDFDLSEGVQPLASNVDGEMLLDACRDLLDTFDGLSAESAYRFRINDGVASEGYLELKTDGSVTCARGGVGGFAVGGISPELLRGLVDALVQLGF